MIKHQCINVTNMTYTGREISPLGKGLSAEGYELNTIMIGCDNVDWIVKYKNNRKVWVRHEKKIDKIVHEEPIEIETKVPIPIQEEKQEKKVNNYIKLMSKRKEEIKIKKNNNMTAKEIYNQILQEWKELKKDTEKYNNVISNL